MYFFKFSFKIIEHKLNKFVHKVCIMNQNKQRQIQRNISTPPYTVHICTIVMPRAKNGQQKVPTLPLDYLLLYANLDGDAAPFLRTAERFECWTGAVCK